MADLFIRLDNNTKKELKELAARESKTIKEIVIEQIINYIKIHKEGNPQHLITNYTENEDFLGFPSMALDISHKKAYVGKMDAKLAQQLFYHVEEWYALLQKK